MIVQYPHPCLIVLRFPRSVFPPQDGSSTEMRIQKLIVTLQGLVYEYVCRCLFKVDRLMFALHLVHGMYSHHFKENVSL